MPSNLYWPLERGHIVTSQFGSRWGTTHWGVDFGREGGSGGMPVYAVRGGTVTHVGPASGFGQWVVLDHPAEEGGGTTVYGHILPEVVGGQRVEAGQRIARINPDSATNGGVAPHLHLEWHRYVWSPPGADRLDPLLKLSGARYPGEDAVPTPPPAPTPQQAAVLDAATLAEAMGNALPLARYEQLAPAFTEAMRQAGCTTVARAAMWCAQIGHESGGLRWMEEIADGSAYEGRTDLGNTQPGDGRKFKGRGPIQITGRFNYTKVSQWAHSKGYVPTPTYFVDNPAELANDKFGFLGPVWYWTVARDMNAFADSRDIVGGTRAVNGGINGLPDRTVRWNNCLTIGDRLVPANTSLEGVDELTPEQDQMLRAVHDELTKRFPSRSEKRENDEPVDTLAGFVLNIDGRIHERAIEDDKLGDQLDAILVALQAVIVALKERK